MDILKEMMMEFIEEKIKECKEQKEIYEYNEYQLNLILDKLKKGEELHSVERSYLSIFMQ